MVIAAFRVSFQVGSRELFGSEEVATCVRDKLCSSFSVGRGPPSRWVAEEADVSYCVVHVL